jgi:hypothetical protein
LSPPPQGLSYEELLQQLEGWTSIQGGTAHDEVGTLHLLAALLRNLRRHRAPILDEPDRLGEILGPEEREVLAQLNRAC